MTDQANTLSRAPFYRRSPFGMERIWRIAGQAVRATGENDVRMNFVVDEEGRARYPACPDCAAQDSIEDPCWDEDDASWGLAECRCSGCGSVFADWRHHPDIR